jgi:hypothetical protein
MIAGKFPCTSSKDYYHSFPLYYRREMINDVMHQRGKITFLRIENALKKNEPGYPENAA